MRRSLPASVFAGLTLFAGVSATETAEAHYCRTTTVKTTQDYNPVVSGCWTQGFPVYWGGSCISYDVQQDGGPNVSPGQAASALATAFSVWTSALCPGGAGTPSISVVNLGEVSCGVVEYNECGPNQHVVVFRSTWPTNDMENELALTTVSFDVDTGELYDADMEINGSVALSLTTPMADGAYDFASIVTHETGHFLGLAHATTTNETMYYELDPGEVRRTLSPQDVDGVCTIYPPQGTRTTETDAGPVVIDAAACDPTPRHGFTTACMPTPVDGGVACEPPPSSGCSVARGHSGPASGAPGLLLAGALTWLVRRRRLRISPRPSSRNHSRSSSASPGPCRCR
jgi:Matrixin